MSNNKNIFKWLIDKLRSMKKRGTLVNDSIIKESIKNILQCPDCGSELKTYKELCKLLCTKCIQIRKNKFIKNNIITAPPNIGYFSNIKELRSLYPRAGEGDLATVGNEIYVYNGKWKKVK